VVGQDINFHSNHLFKGIINEKETYSKSTSFVLDHN